MVRLSSRERVARKLPDLLNDWITRDIAMYECGKRASFFLKVLVREGLVEKKIIRNKLYYRKVNKAAESEIEEVIRCW